MKSIIRAILIVNLAPRLSFAACRVTGTVAAQIAGMSSTARVMTITIATILTGLYGYDEFAGDPPNASQQAKLERAEDLIAKGGFPELARRARSLRFRIVKDLLESKDGWGYTPFFAVKTVWLDASMFAQDNEAFAAIIIHETEHTMTWANHWREGPSYQVQSAFLWNARGGGPVKDIGPPPPNTALVNSATPASGIEIGRARPLKN
jgi:hypothetical protein